MCLQIHLGFEDIGFVSLTFGVKTNEMRQLEMLLKFLVVQVILWVAALIPPVTYVAPLVSLAAVRVQFVVTVESLLTKPTFGMSFETGLIDRTRVVVAESLMPA